MAQPKHQKAALILPHWEDENIRCCPDQIAVGSARWAERVSPLVDGKGSLDFGGTSPAFRAGVFLDELGGPLKFAVPLAAKPAYEGNLSIGMTAMEAASCIYSMIYPGSLPEDAPTKRRIRRILSIVHAMN